MIEYDELPSHEDELYAMRGTLLTAYPPMGDPDADGPEGESRSAEALRDALRIAGASESWWDDCAVCALSATANRHGPVEEGCPAPEEHHPFVPQAPRKIDLILGALDSLGYAVVRAK